MFKKIRISVLLFILFLVGAKAYLTHERIIAWERPLSMVIYPINADGSPFAADYINRLGRDDFKPVADFMQTEGLRYNAAFAEPLVIPELAPQIGTQPPAPPFGGPVWAIMWWSLKLRYWAWKNDTYGGPAADIRVFVLYHNPDAGRRPGHSLGLKEGHISMVQAFAGRHQAARTNMIIVHEVLHTLGAVDKYDMQTLQPVYPHGYGDPDQSPLLPQKYAEIMGGAIPLSNTESDMPDSLAKTVIGPQTAREIRWLE